MIAIPVGKFRTEAADGRGLDPFGRTRSSHAHILLSSYQIFDGQPLVWDTALTGAGTATHVPAKARTEMTVGTASGDKVIRQTKRYWHYRSGQGQQIIVSFSGGDQVANVRKRVGYFDDNDGIFLEVTSASLSLVLRSSTSGAPVDTPVAQASWNVDTLDGGGPSGLTLDITKAQVFCIDLQWLGAGRVRCGFDIGGTLHYAHEFVQANVGALVYMRTPTLPVRLEIENTDVSAGATLHHTCAAVNREGGTEEEGALCTAATGFAATTATTTARSLLSVSLRSGYERAFLRPLAISILNRDSGSIFWQLVLNPTLGGALSYTNIGQTAQQSITQQTYTVATGHRLAAGYVASSNQVKDQAAVGVESNIFVASGIAGTPDVLSLIVESQTGTLNAHGSISFLEYN